MRALKMPAGYQNANCILLPNKELGYRRGTAGRFMSVEVMSTAALLYEKLVQLDSLAIGVLHVIFVQNKLSIFTKNLLLKSMFNMHIVQNNN